MLTLDEVSQQRRPRRAPPSTKQQYQEYILQRIEAYKNSIPRDELLALGDEAVTELSTSGAGQFLLTEILVAEMVDGLIERRLRLPKLAKWRKQHAARLDAQRQPVHWGIDPASALASLLPRVEDKDNVLVIGAGAQNAAFLLAAHHTEVTFLDEDMSVVEQVEARMAGEALCGQFMGYVARLGDWLPQFERELNLVVLDAGTLAALTHANRTALLIAVRNLTKPTGVHAIVPGTGPAAPEAYLSHYPDWDREPLPGNRRGRASRSRGVIMSRPHQ